MSSHDVDDDFDDRLLDEAAQQVEVLLDLPPDDLLERLRTLVRQTFTARRPDGTWPPTELLVEVLRSYLDVLDARDRDLPRTGGPTPPRWIAAWREAAESPTLLQRLLDELRDHDDRSGIPNMIPLPDGRTIPSMWFAHDG